MHKGISKQQVKPLAGKTVYAIKKDGTVVSGKLVQIKGNQIVIKTQSRGKAQTSALLPLVLYDLLAIGTLPYGYGFGGFGFPYGYGGFGPGFFF